MGILGKFLSSFAKYFPYLLRKFFFPHKTADWPHKNYNYN